MSTVEPGDSEPSITPAGVGYALVDPAASGNLADCTDDSLCSWEMGGFLGTMSVQSGPSGCLSATPASIANASSDLVAYLYNSDDCSGPAAIVEPDFSSGDLVDAAGDGPPQSMQVDELADPASLSAKPLAFAVVGTNAFITFPDWDTCVASVATACFEHADGSVEGEIDPTQLASLATGGLLPAKDLDQILADLPLVGDHPDGCTLIPALGSDPMIIVASDNTGNLLELGPGNCSDVEGTDEAAGTDQVVGADETAVLAPVDAAIVTADCVSRFEVVYVYRGFVENGKAVTRNQSVNGKPVCPKIPEPPPAEKDLPPVGPPGCVSRFEVQYFYRGIVVNGKAVTRYQNVNGKPVCKYLTA